MFITIICFKQGLYKTSYLQQLWAPPVLLAILSKELGVFNTLCWCEGKF